MSYLKQIQGMRLQGFALQTACNAVGVNEAIYYHWLYKKQNKPTKFRAGFTLLELSIVLVIVGLLAGGVLVGQDLIRASEIRAAASQYEKYNTAINTFRVKYNGIPGDLARRQAESFGLCPLAGCPAADGIGFGDNNSKLNDTIVAGNTNQPSGEILAFWAQLSAANLVDGSFGRETTNAYGIGANPTAQKYFPESKLGGSWVVGSDNSANYFGLVQFTDFQQASFAVDTGVITPIEAFNLDNKLDDGKPNAGIVQARGFSGSGAIFSEFYSPLTASNAAPSGLDVSLGSATVGACTMGASATATDNSYMLYNNSDAPAGSTPACTLIMRMM